MRQGFARAWGIPHRALRPNPTTAARVAPRELFAFWALAFAAVRWVAPSGPLYWDSFSYAAQAVSGQVGGLGLGRPLFVLLSHGLASLALGLGASLDSIEPLLRAVWGMVAALSAPLALLVAQSLGLDRQAQRWMAAAVALSPAMAHASGQVLTDGPAVTAVLASTLCAVRAKDGDGAREALLWLGAGAALGAAIVFREPAIAHALVLYGLISLGPKGTRSRAVVTATAALILVAGLSLVWAARQPGWADTVRNWVGAMRRERAEHPYRARDFAMYLAWLVALGPVTLVAALAGWARVRRTLAEHPRAFAVVALGSLAQLVALGAYQDIAFSPRYLLGAMPGALALVAAHTLSRWARTRARIALASSAMVLSVALAGLGLGARERPLRAAIDTVSARLRAEPEASLVIVTGQVCPAVQMQQRFERARAQREGRAPRAWQTVCPGWDWPANLQLAMERHAREGRAVIVDLREGVWVGDRQLRARAELEAWLARGSDVARSARVWR
jgi:hypothetical protein